MRIWLGLNCPRPNLLRTLRTVVGTTRTSHLIPLSVCSWGEADVGSMDRELPGLTRGGHRPRADLAAHNAL